MTSETPATGTVTTELAPPVPHASIRPVPWFSWSLHAGGGHSAALDGVRGLAMLLLFLYHVALYPPWRAPFAAGWSGVDLFFVLSGFLITGLYVDAEGEPHRLRNFWIRRVLRILPLYYLVLAGLALKIWLEGAPDAGRVLSQQFWFWAHLQNCFMALRGWFSPWHYCHLWSLALEMHFYLLWPLLLGALGARRALIACLVLALASLALRNLLPIGFPFSYVFTFTRLEGLMIGAAIALLLRLDRERLARVAPGVFLLSALALALLIAQQGGLHNNDPLVMRVGFLLLPLFFGGMLVSVFDGGRTGRFSRAFFELRALRIIGKYSYGIFLFHWIVHLELKAPLMQKFRLATGSDLQAFLLSFLVQAAVTMALSVASYHVIELPFLRLKDVFAPRSAEARPAN